MSCLLKWIFCIPFNYIYIYILILSLSYFLSTFLFAQLLPHKENRIIRKNKGNLFCFDNCKKQRTWSQGFSITPLDYKPNQKTFLYWPINHQLSNSIIRMKKREVWGALDAPLSNSQPNKKNCRAAINENWKYEWRNTHFDPSPKFLSKLTFLL